MRDIGIASGNNLHVKNQLYRLERLDKSFTNDNHHPFHLSFQESSNFDCFIKDCNQKVVNLIIRNILGIRGFFCTYFHHNVYIDHIYLIDFIVLMKMNSQTIKYS